MKSTSTLDSIEKTPLYNKSRREGEGVRTNRIPQHYWHNDSPESKEKETEIEQ